MDGTISCGHQVVFAFPRRASSQDVSDGAPEGFPAAGASVAQPMLVLGKGLFDGVEIGAVWRQEQQMRPRTTYRLAHGGTFVTAQIVHHARIASHFRRRSGFAHSVEKQCVVGAESSGTNDPPDCLAAKERAPRWSRCRRAKLGIARVTHRDLQIEQRPPRSANGTVCSGLLGGGGDTCEKNDASPTMFLGCPSFLSVMGFHENTARGMCEA